MRERFRRYLDARIGAYQKLPDIQAAQAMLSESTDLQAEIWREAIAAGQSEGASPDAIKLLLPALNDMIDITTTRITATEIHPPRIVYVMLVILTLVAALIAGYGMAGARLRSWSHILGFSTVMALAIYIIIDLEYPRLGLIRVDTFDQTLVDLRDSMG